MYSNLAITVTVYSLKKTKSEYSKLKMFDINNYVCVMHHAIKYITCNTIVCVLTNVWINLQYNNFSITSEFMKAQDR